MLSDSKSVLAKLLAQENIRVEHRKVKTAYFNLKDRVLVCPIWGEMSSELYDLLMGHEVSHALHTPYEGWHDECEAHKGGFRTYLNVIEDARIEKMIKLKYPGLRSSFSKAYSELAATEFFGPRHIIESDHLPLIDRINLHFKIGAFANVQFDLEEKAYIRKVSECETWEDVVAIASELYEHGKQEQKEMRELFEEMMKDYEWEKSEDQDNLGDDGLEMDMEAGDNSDDDFLPEDLDELREMIEHMERRSGGVDGDEPRSITDDAFREKESEFLDSKSKPYAYADVPKANLKNIIIPHSFLAKKMDDWRIKLYQWADYEEQQKFAENPEKMLQRGYDVLEESKDKVYAEFMNNNKKYIGYLVKEFELRRNAKQFARAKQAKTGEIDVKKVFSYKFNEDIFKRVTTIPGGKNHGMVMVLDCSGSMFSNMKGTIQQTILLAMFCRKVNIPFRVYGFSDCADTKLVNDYFNRERNDVMCDVFSVNTGELFMRDSQFFMKEYLTSEMTSKQFNKMVREWLMVGEAYSVDPDTWKPNGYTLTVDGVRLHTKWPVCEELGGTPLNEAVLATTEIVKQFKEENKLDVVNAIFLTDGEGHSLTEVVTGPPVEEEFMDRKYFKIPKTYMYKDAPEYNCNFVLVDRRTGVRGTAKAGSSKTVAFFDYMRNLTGANIVGFHLMPRPTPSNIREFAKEHGVWLSEAELSASTKSMKQNKFTSISMPGVKQFFLMPAGKDLNVEEDGLQIDSDDVKDIRKAFMKMQKNKLVNRVFLNRFIEQVA